MHTRARYVPILYYVVIARKFIAGDPTQDEFK